MYTFMKKKKSAVPDLQMVLGIVYCFSLKASIKPTLTAHILAWRSKSATHTHPKRGRPDGVTVRAMLWL